MLFLLLRNFCCFGFSENFWFLLLFTKTAGSCCWYVLVPAAASWSLNFPAVAPVSNIHFGFFKSNFHYCSSSSSVRLSFLFLFLFCTSGRRLARQLHEPLLPAEPPLLFLYRTCKLYAGLQCRFAEPLAANPFSCYIYPCVAAVGGGGGGGLRERESWWFALDSCFCMPSLPRRRAEERFWELSSGCSSCFLLVLARIKLVSSLTDRRSWRVSGSNQQT